MGEVRTMEDLLSRSMATETFRTVVLTIFACSALFLAAIGVYGLMAYVVSDRVHEVGIRLALGAESTDIRNMVVFQGMRPALAGGIAGWRQGVMWGLAAFAVFTLAPGLGLPPELPAMPAADLGPRQLWWIGTVAASASGLALIVYGRSLLAIGAGVALLVAPHIIGAPQPVSYETPIPEGLHHSFVVAVVMTTLVFWVLLGGLAGYFRERFVASA